MFDQAKVLYIVDDNAGLVENIVSDLRKNNILKYFFNEEVESSNKSFSKFISSLPKKTIFCAYLNYNKDINTKVSIAIPFISSHVNFPVKVGETIWFYKYGSQSQNTGPYVNYDIDGYYLGRVHSLINTEDTAYAFSEREKTLFNTNNFDLDDEVNDRKSGILELLEANENYFIDPETIIFKPEIGSLSSLSGEVLNSSYYENILKNYSLPSSNKLLSKAEDLCLTGTYNATINLTSVSSEKESISDNIEIEPKKGKIEIIAGENERLKKRSFRSTKSTKSVGLDGFVSDNESVISIYDNNFFPEVFNGIFTESIKTPRHIVSTSIEDKILKEDFTYSKNKNILDNSASFVISEDKSDFSLIRQDLIYSIPTIDLLFDEKNNSSNLLNGASFTTTLPTVDADPRNSFGDDVFSSSITSIADNIIISTHEKSDSEIILTTPNSSDGKKNYLRITNTGNIHLNSEKIVVGDASRLTSSNGTNAGLFLGFSKDMQSLVLGEQLKAFIEEMLSVQKESITLIKDLFIFSKNVDNQTKEALNEISSTMSTLGTDLTGVSQGPPPLAALATSAANLTINTEFNVNDKISAIEIEEYDNKISEFKASKLQNKEKESKSDAVTGEILYKRLTNIEKNLDRILSKFTKTTWLSHYLYN